MVEKIKKMITDASRFVCNTADLNQYFVMNSKTC